jgi:glycosyltransferase involved in cell wall biosynthesis
MKKKLKIVHNKNFSRPQVKGKFIYRNDVKIYLKGVTYGTFKPLEDGSQFPEEDIIRRDLQMIAANGFNCIRTYTVPSKKLLDQAYEMDLMVMVGLPWEQHITFLDNDNLKIDILKRVSEAVLNCNAHPAIFCYAIGNEIPGPIVRWHGKKKIENFLKRLYLEVKQADPEGLVTYVNYPTTEYLDLSFCDFDCFNVYLETPEKLGHYISRLHNLSGDRPLVLAEIGLDSRRNSPEKQAETLSWQTETIFGKGCAGMFVFAWTDEWWRGGFEIEDWDFGLVTRQRLPKPALNAVAKTMKNIPVYSGIKYPFISVVVCSYNGSATIRETLREIMKLNYPSFEIIVINDGSKDNFSEIVKEFPVKLISTVNNGLSSARNTGMMHAKGEIIAYIDDDAYPDADWLNYLAYAYTTTDHAAIGGPNIAPGTDGFIANCVANAPGGPVHVLVTDELAEHIPGCNMTFRREALMNIGGFDPVFRSAGDDVDVCWRIQQSGRTIGFHPSAVVWHHRRNSLKAYWKQQKGYGKAEALLEAKWPEKYNSLGHLTWEGRIYGNGLTLPIKVRKEKIFYGTWGSALFQSVYQPGDKLINLLPLMPEWYLFSASTFVLGCLGFFWLPLMWSWAVFFLSVAIVIFQAYKSSRTNTIIDPKEKYNLKYILLTTFLHVMQPIARLYGRLTHGLTPWRKRGNIKSTGLFYGMKQHIFTYWSETWKSSEEWLMFLEKKLIGQQNRVKRGDDFSNWDLQIRNGLFGQTHALFTIEEHGAGKQYLRLRCRPIHKGRTFIFPGFFFLLTLFAFLSGEYIAGLVTFSLFSVFVFNYLSETNRTMSSLEEAFKFEGIELPFDKAINVNIKEINEILNEPVYSLNESYKKIKESEEINKSKKATGVFEVEEI